MKLNPPIGVALLSFAHTHQAHWVKALTADAQLVPPAFLDCLTSGEPRPSTLTDGTAALEMILGAYQAAAERRTVPFPLPGGVLRPHGE